jgi:phosphate transport system substrate-binding protein
MMLRRIAMGCLVLLAVAPGCQPVSEVDYHAESVMEGKLRFSGSSTIGPLVQSIAKRIRKRHPGFEIEIELGGSSKGIVDAQQGRIDIGMVSRALGAKESQLCSFALARDGVCLIVHGGNPVRSLSQQQVRDIFAGTILTWKEVGGIDAPINVLSRGKTRSEVELFAQFFKLAEKDIRAKGTLEDNADALQAVLDDPLAITFVSLGEAERKQRQGRFFKLLELDGVEASSANVRNGCYAFSRPLVLVMRALPTKTAKAFVEFATSSQVADLIQQHDFIPYVD